MKDRWAVVVTWNGEQLIGRCLQSLLSSEASVRVVVVDNASADGTVDVVREVCPEAACFRLRRNLGFGRANNVGIKHAYDRGAEHILLLNQDAYVEPDVVGELVDLQRSQPAFGILSPLHLDGTGAYLDRRFCDHVSEASSMRQLLSDLLLDEDPADIYRAEFINAAVWLMSRACIERVGLFNPAFEHYGEDLEYADRVRFHGLHIGLVPSSRAYHARAQEGLEQSTGLKRHLMKEKAIIRHKLSRRSHTTAFNLLSALPRLLFSEYPRGRPIQQRVRVKLALGAYLLTSIVPVLRRRALAYEGGRCFFDDAEDDRRRFSLTAD
jgi:GT2 family glycosyltransferase